MSVWLGEDTLLMENPSASFPRLFDVLCQSSKATTKRSYLYVICFSSLMLVFCDG